jgi:hypothetical protein
MAYDPVQARVVLFGGFGRSALLNDTWVWNGTWAPMETTASPEARSLHALASQKTGVLLFGGSSFAQPGRLFGDTWELSGTSWVRRTSASSPPAREGHAMAFDPNRQGVLLFGGRNREGQELGDTWLWDGSDWKELQPDAQPRATDHGLIMVSDDSRKRIVLHGAEDASGSWEWDGTSWKWARAKGLPLGWLRRGAYHPVRKALIVVIEKQERYVCETETWMWEGRTWTRVDSPTAQRPTFGTFAMAEDRARGTIILFGGYRPVRGFLGKPDLVTCAETWLFR